MEGIVKRGDRGLPESQFTAETPRAQRENKKNSAFSASLR